MTVGHRREPPAAAASPHGRPETMNTARALRDEPWPTTPDRARAALALVRVVERARTPRTPERVAAPSKPRTRRKRTRTR